MNVMVKLFPNSFAKESLQRYILPLTFLKCKSCGTVNSREFREGDYIFKTTNEACPKCGATEMVIESIHVEEKQLEKKSAT